MSVNRVLAVDDVHVQASHMGSSAVGDNSNSKDGLLHAINYPDIEQLAIRCMMTS